MTDTPAPDVVVTEAPVDGGFDGASVEAAETLWACLPHVRKWTSLATHEKALVIHTFARLSTQSAMQARIEELEAALRFYADAEKWDDFAADQQASVFDRNFGSELGSDRGALARATLSNIGGSNDG